MKEISENINELKFVDMSMKESIFIKPNFSFKLLFKKISLSNIV